LAWYLRYRTNYRTLAGLIRPLGLTLLPMFLILKEPDLGTVLLLLPVFFAMLLVAGAKRRHLAGLLMMCVLAAPALYYAMHDYQRMRVLGAVLQAEAARAWLLAHPKALSVLQVTPAQVAQWQRDEGYQLDRSKATLATGGVTGVRDADADCMQYGFLPEWHTDFIFAVVGHRWGLVGCGLVLACYGVILAGGCRIAAATNEPFGRLLAVGAVVLLTTQAMINVGMAIGLWPVAGITLPFVSYGGSSLTASGAIMGLLLSVGLRKPIVLAPEPFLFEDLSEGREMRLPPCKSRGPLRCGLGIFNGSENRGGQIAAGAGRAIIGQCGRGQPNVCLADPRSSGIDCGIAPNVHTDGTV
jgi:rod shape determining protein RodA